VEPRDRRRFDARVRLLGLGLLVGTALVAVRAIQLQIHEHEELARLARSQYLNDVTIPARRGQIYDRNSKPLAISVDVPSVYANPPMVTDPRAAARALAPLLGLELDAVYQRLASERYFAWLKRQVAPEVAAKVRGLGLAGIGITQESRRFYPNRELGSHLLGFTDIDGHGIEGLERSLDDVLAGEPQVVAVEKDGRGKAVLQGGLDPEQRSRGADVYLTIDMQIQHAAEAALGRAVAQSRAHSGMAVVLDATNADLLAMAVAPSFNPNVAAEVPADKRRNRVLTDVFEPGSSMKPLVVAAALDTKAVRPDATIFCENGAMTIANHTIRDTHQNGWLTLTGIIQKSSNIGAAKVGQALGRERLAAALRSYGFGQRTGIPFPGEVAGLLREPTAWSQINVATISFGHGVAVTALQLAAAYRSLAAHGAYRQPRLVRAIESADGKPSGATSAAADTSVLSADTVRRMRGMLEAVVGPGGTGQLAAVPGYRVAGKTGTAQKVDPLTGGYSSDEYVAVFAGFLPSEAPRAVLVVAIDDPEGEHTGGQVAAPVFAEIGAATMRALGVVPSDNVAVAAPPLAPAAPTAAPAEDVLPADASVVKPGAMPSFVGLTAREVISRYAEVGQGLDLVMSGSGRVRKQQPDVGSDLGRATRLSLFLAE
jgi:cell division protein FtsI (penicillin-binding protein 3)